MTKTDKDILVTVMNKNSHGPGGSGSIYSVKDHDGGGVELWQWYREKMGYKLIYSGQTFSFRSGNDMVTVTG